MISKGSRGNIDCCIALRKMIKDLNLNVSESITLPSTLPESETKKIKRCGSVDESKPFKKQKTVPKNSLSSFREATNVYSELYTFLNNLKNSQEKNLELIKSTMDWILSNSNGDNLTTTLYEHAMQLTVPSPSVRNIQRCNVDTPSSITYDPKTPRTYSVWPGFASKSD